MQEAEELVRGQLPPAVGKSRGAAAHPCAHPHLRVGFEGQGHVGSYQLVGINGEMTARYQTLVHGDVIIPYCDFCRRP